VDSESGKPIELALQRLWLQGKILAVGARLIVRHVFRSGETKPLEVIYTFALPRDATLRQFMVIGEGFRVRSRLEPTEKAVKEYEEATQRGSLATLARQYGDGIVSLAVGNLRPQETVVVLLEVLAGVQTLDAGLRFRFPFTLAPSYHARARAAETEPGVGEIELPEDEFQDLVLPRFHKDSTGLHEVGFMLSVAMGLPVCEISSPSHSVHVKTGEGAQSRVTLTAGQDLPNRDLVLDVSTRKLHPFVLCGMGKDQRTRFAAVAPSHAFGETPAVPRRVVFVLDRSGSMGGAPIEQAKKALAACLGALMEEDEFGIIAFDDNFVEFGPGLHKGNKRSRDQAREFINLLDAGGGTELAQALTAALKLLDNVTGDILILTDGQVFGTEHLLSQARAGGVRLHCLGIGSASQDRFLSLLARESGGICRFLTPRERVDLAAVDLFASVGRPVAGEVKARVEGVAAWRIAPDAATAVFAGTPLSFFGECEGREALIVVEWTKPQPGKLEIPLKAADRGLDETLRLLQGSRLITDLDAKYTGEASERALDRREQKRLGDQLEALSKAYGLASRCMSLVAVVERTGDRAGELPRTVVVPVGMPQDVVMGAYFGQPHASSQLLAALPGPPAYMAAPAAPAASPSLFTKMLGKLSSKGPPAAPKDVGSGDEFELPAFLRRRPQAPEDALLDLAQQIEPDGGMPGENEFERMVHSLVAILAFVVEGHTRATGAFRAHVQRLMHFLEDSKFSSLSTQNRDALGAVLEWIRKGNKPTQSLSEILSWKVDEAWEQMTKFAA